jgi:hypothetical protein
LAEKISITKTTTEKSIRNICERKSAFEILKDEVKIFLAEYNISMQTKDNPNENLTYDTPPEINICNEPCSNERLF